jgi:hypothetical protein
LEKDIAEKLLVLDRLLNQAAKDPSFRRKFFSEYEKILKSYDLPEEITVLINKCLTDLAK